MRSDVLILLSDGLVILCLTRFLLQWVQLDARHSLLHFCAHATEWLVKPLRKIIPSTPRRDWACILAGGMLYYLVYTFIALVMLPSGFDGKIIMANLLFAALGLLKSAAYVLLIGLVLRMMVSFSNPYSPLAATLQRVFEPILRPFAFLRINRYDFSGSVLALALWLWLSRFLPQLTAQINIWLLH